MPRNTLPFLRRLLVGLSLSAFTFSSAIGADETIDSGTQTGAAPSLKMVPHTFEGRGGQVVEAEMGSFHVPENRERDDSRTIELRFVRFPATGQNPGPPIVYLAGGPGGSGISTAKGPRFPLFMALREYGDVIAFDQRGTGLSNAIPFCKASKAFPLERPLTRSHLMDWLEPTAKECAEFWREEGVDLEGYDTVESAHDLEDLRQALGVPKIRLWSISYGTHLAFAALRHHGDSIDRVILASAEGPDETMKLPGRTQAFLERIHDLASKDPKLQQVVPDFLGALEQVLRGLEKEPVEVEVSDPRGGPTARVVIGDYDVRILLGFLVKNPDSIAYLPLTVQAMALGDYSQVAPYILQVRQYFQGLRGMSEAMDAASGITAERARQVERDRKTTLLGDALNFPGPWLAGPLGIEILPDTFRSPLVSDVPALFLSGSLDGRTYVESHRELAAGFEHGIHVVVEGAGHDLFLSSPEVLARMEDFLAGRRVTEESIRLPFAFISEIPGATSVGE